MKLQVYFAAFLLVGCSAYDDEIEPETINISSSAISNQDTSRILLKSNNSFDNYYCKPQRLFVGQIPPNFFLDPECPPEIIDSPRLLNPYDPGPK